MAHRYFTDTRVTSDQAELCGSEAHHLQHVMRAQAGDEVTLFDGSGKEFTARVERLERSQVQLAVLASHEVNRESARRITVGVALPKGERQRYLVEKLTELGVHRLVPLRTERSVVHPDDRAASKLRRSVIEASKQCGRNLLMEIAPLVSLSEFLTAAPVTATRWLADPLGEPLARGLESAADVFIAVGPEGGFAVQEQRGARDEGWSVVSLGPRILRIETACAAMVALAAYDVEHPGCVGPAVD